MGTWACWRSGLVGVVVAALMVGSGGPAVAVSAGAGALPGVVVSRVVEQSSSRRGRVDSAVDEVSARVSARAQGSRVLVDSLTSETSRTWVNPDGSLSTETAAGPVRVRDESGRWADVDLTLVERAGGVVAPKRAAVALTLPGGAVGAFEAGATAAVSAYESGGRGVDLFWRGRLGKPVLRGNVATYADVAPGVDFQVEALRSGFEQSFIVKDASAVDPVKGLMFTVPVRTRGMTARVAKSGDVEFVDNKGKVVSVFAAPAAWDASVDRHAGPNMPQAKVVMSVVQRGGPDPGSRTRGWFTRRVPA